jgi:hypothetical protein
MTSKKLYLLYRGDSLYGFTDEKKLVKKFLKQRNPKFFKLKKKKFDENEYEKFISSNRQLLLIPEYLYNGVSDIDMVLTIDENYNINKEVSSIINMMENTLLKAKKIGLNDDITKSIDVINKKYISNFYEYINIDSLQIFIKYYGYTIMKGFKDEKINTARNI